MSWQPWCALVAAALVNLAAAEPAQPAKPYTTVPAVMCQPRDGLGNVFSKLQAGGPVTICYFGGSITAQPGWRVKTFDWFKQTYPQAKLTQIDATIGGTNSEHGVYRCGQDVLAFKPDLVFVEFAVNDNGMNHNDNFRSMEGIVRQIWRANPATDICFVYTFVRGYDKQLDKGDNPSAASAHELIADWYGIPSINVALRASQMMHDGKMILTPRKGPDGKDLPADPGVLIFSDDGVHPRIESGHQVYFEACREAFDQLRRDPKPGAHTLRTPFIADNWEAAKLVPLKASMLSPEWSNAPIHQTRDFHNRLPELWHTETPGATLSFRFRGVTAKLYDLLGPDGGMVTVEVDGKVGKPIPRFDSYCSYWRLANLPLFSSATEGEHTVKVTLLDKQPDRSSVTKIESAKPGYDPKKYDGTRLWVGSIMVLGDVIE
jgi:hypothetical protein